jgi:hypothetical protein
MLKQYRNYSNKVINRSTKSTGGSKKLPVDRINRELSNKINSNQIKSSATQIKSSFYQKSKI